MKQYLAFVLCWLSLNTAGQLSEIRSLIEERNKLSASEIPEHYYKVSAAYFELNELDQAIRYCRKSINSAREQKDSIQLAKSLSLIINQFLSSNRIDSAYIRLNQLDKSFSDKATQLQCLVLYTEIWSKIPGNNRYIKQFNKALDSGELSSIEYYSLGVRANRNQENYEKALAYGFKGLELADKTANREAELHFNLELAKVYQDLNQELQANSLLSRYTEKCTKSGYNLGQIKARIQQAKSDENKSEALLKEAYNALDTSITPRLKSELLSAYALSLKGRRKAKRGVQYGLEALNIAEQLNDPYLGYQAHKAISKNYATLSFRESFQQYEELAVQSLEELNALESAKLKSYFNQLVFALEQCFESQKRQLTKELKHAQSELELERREGKSFSYLFYFIVAILFISLLVFIYSRNAENLKK